MQHSGKFDCIVIGAGISGLLAATQLKEAGKSVLVLDKGRGVGGRMATRRMGEARIDHGAQFFTQRSDVFKPWVQGWVASGKLSKWYRDKFDLCWRGKTGMTDVPKLLAQNLEISKSTKIIEVSYEQDTWTLKSEDAQSFTSQSLIITAPLPQALSLLKNSDIELPAADYEALDSVRYTRCLVALGTLNSKSKIREPGILKIEKSIVESITDNQKKGISPIASFTIHSSPEFAEKYWDSPNDVRLPLLLDAAQQYLGSEVAEASVHRWGFAKTLAPRPENHYCFAPLHLALAGDGFLGGRVESAAQSGLAAAASVSKLL
ncbi:MAG: NAD(P)/FAD-dependent oxidoreductase [Opitutales bacterium]